MTAHDAARPSSNGFVNIIGKLSVFCGWIAASMIVLAVAITCQMIFVRFVLNQSTIWQTEAVVYLMIAATLIGLPYVQKLRGHVNVDLVPLMLPGGLRKALAIVTLSVSILVIALMTYYGYHQWHEAWAKGWKSDTVWGVRLWIPYLAVPVGCGLFVLQLVADLIGVAGGTERPFGLAEKD